MVSRNTEKQNTKPIKIAVAGIIHETNSFAPGTTEIEHFQGEWVSGKEAFYERYIGSKTSMGGVIDAVKGENIELIPGLYTAATPSGMVSTEAAERLIDAVVNSVDSNIDGLLVILHGAMVSEKYMDVEGEILSRFRQRFSNSLPIAITLDLHANISKEMVDLTNILVGYDTYPHIDAYERAIEAIKLLTKLIRIEIQPVSHWQHSRMLVAPQSMITTEGVMKELMERAFAMEQHDEVLNVTVAGGFPFSDVPDAGMSFVITTNGNKLLAEKYAHELSQMVWERRDRFIVKEHSVKQAIQFALETTEGPNIFVEGSDNVGGGSPADATHTLRHLLKENCKSLITIRDVDASYKAHQLGVGAIFEDWIGGKSDDLHGESVKINGRIRLLFDGFYRHVGPYMTGQLANMGKTAMIETNNVTIILTENRTAPWDIGHVRSVGLNPEDFKIIVVKAAIAWKTAFGKFAKNEFYLDTPGCCSSNLHYFHYQNVKRPVYPFDNLE